MALNWKTYNAIPRLANYAEAKRWHDDVAPIRGCTGKTRPVGRRDQPWFSIWETGAGIHVGYGRNEGLSQRQTLVLYHRSGAIQLHKRNRRSSASDHERRQRLLGTDFRTHQYDTWVRCAWYDRGEKRKGYLPLHCNGKRNWDVEPAVSTFVRDGDDLVFVNYAYPVTHKPSRDKLKEALAPYRDFIAFCEGLRKLQGDDKLTFTQDTRAEYFGWSGHNDYRGNPTACSAPNLNWGTEVDANRAWFFEKAASSDHDDRMRAAITMVQNTNDKPVAFFTDMLLRERHDDLLEAHVQTHGGLATDRYKRYLRQ